MSINITEIANSKEVDAKTFGKVIKEIREDRGESIRGLSAKLGITPTYLNDIEKGNRCAPKNYLEKLYEELQIPEEQKEGFFDLAAVSRGFLYDDINPYLGQSTAARSALRVARDLNVSDNVWYSFIEQLKNSKIED